MVEPSKGKRSEDDVLEAILGQRARKPERRIRRRRRPPRDEHADPRRQPSHGERDRFLRRAVEPLHVVDREQHRLTLGEDGEDADERRRRRPRRRRPVRLLAQERRAERPLLDDGKPRARAVEDVADEVGERSVGEVGLALRRLRLEHAEPATARQADARRPEGRLPDPGRSVDGDGARRIRHPVEEAPDRCKLGLAAENLVLHCRSDPTAHARAAAGDLEAVDGRPAPAHPPQDSYWTIRSTSPVPGNTLRFET